MQSVYHHITNYQLNYMLYTIPTDYQRNLVLVFLFFKKKIWSYNKA